MYLKDTDALMLACLDLVIRLPERTFEDRGHFRYYEGVKNRMTVRVRVMEAAEGTQIDLSIIGQHVNNLKQVKVRSLQDVIEVRSYCKRLRLQ